MPMYMYTGRRRANFEHMFEHEWYYMYMYITDPR